jgi:50S ribosomal subunit-associated GTPase HflX
MGMILQLARMYHIVRKGGWDDTEQATFDELKSLIESAGYEVISIARNSLT